MKPTVGRIVHYYPTNAQRTSLQFAGNPVSPEDPVAAMEGHWMWPPRA